MTLNRRRVPLLLVASLTFLACTGMLGLPAYPHERVDETALRRFIARCEGAISSQDWDYVSSCFLPTAKIGYHEPGKPWKQMELEEWLHSVRFLGEQAGYRRDRDIKSIEVAEEQYATITSDFREEFLVPGGRRIFHMREVIGIIIYQGAFHISSVAYDVQREETKEL